MGKPHKHAEVIKAWADGAEVECLHSLSENGNWISYNGNAGFPLEVYGVVFEYRIKPEPKYPETRMRYSDLEREYYDFAVKDSGLDSWDSGAARNLANAAIRRAIEDGDVILPESAK